jgi:CCR4-NOT transcription complex subunit 9
MFSSVCRVIPNLYTALQGLTKSISLSDNNRAREALRHSLPEPLRDATFSSVLRDDAATKRCLAQLLINLSDNVNDPQNVGGGM